MLPPEYRAFLESGRGSEHAPRAEAGPVTFHTDPLSVVLPVDSEDLAWASEDPHSGERGYYAFRAVDLVAPARGLRVRRRRPARIASIGPDG